MKNQCNIKRYSSTVQYYLVVIFYFFYCAGAVLFFYQTFGHNLIIVFLLQGNDVNTGW